MKAGRRLRLALRAATLVACSGLSLAFLAPLAPGLAPLAASQERDLTSILEEQELLRRQLQRLERTMEALIPRLEQEGRPRALELLREGLKLLEVRSDQTGQLTMEELMDKIREDVQAGQVATSIQRQELIIAHLERLLSVLLDRQDLESLDTALEQLKELQKGLEGLKTREQELQKATEKLREDSASPEQKSLEAELDRILQAQRALLERNEASGRSSGAHALEQIEQELARLLERQRVDREVLESWQPGAQPTAPELESALSAARRASAQAERLERAAGELREAARSATGSASEADVQQATSKLDSAADREQRHQRASNDPTAKRTSDALREAASKLREAGHEAGARERAGGDMVAKAEELEREAAALEAQAQAEREKALASASRPAKLQPSSETPPAEGGERAPSPGEAELRDALERAVAAGKQAAARAGDRTSAEARQATEEAAQALQRAHDDQQKLGPALATSQREAAETAERLERGLESLPAPKPGGEEAARSALQRAAEALKEASSSARGQDSEKAAENALSAEKALEEAQRALSGARAERTAANRASSADEASKIAGEQSRLSRETSAARSKASSSGSMSREAQSEVEQSLDQARQAMEQASSEMEAGRSASAAESQREALDALDRARQAAENGVEPKDAGDQAKAQELAREQKSIEKELLELAQRNRERKNSRPVPSLDSASQSASQAGSSLEEGELGEAQQQEGETEKQMDSALDELREEEEQYQRLRQEELLFRIAEEVTTLLEAENQALTQIREVDAGRGNEERLSRADRLRLRRVSADLAQAAKRTGEIAESIEKEKAGVTAHVLREVRQDIERVGADIDEQGGNDTGERTQALLEDSIETTQWIRDALKSEQQRRNQQQQPQQPQQQQQGQEPLVPDVAELKLLRQLEVDTLGSLDRLLALYPELRSADVEPEVLEDVLRLAERHDRTTELFKRFRQRLGIEDPEQKP
jgi:hypothetical protein